MTWSLREFIAFPQIPTEQRDCGGECHCQLHALQTIILICIGTLKTIVIHLNERVEGCIYIISKTCLD